MVASSLFWRSLLLCALGSSYHVAAACTRSITAKQGDTCATLSSQAGITVTEFLNSNPSVTSCSQLLVGGSYCVEGIAATSTGATPSPSGLTVSTDGSCGQGVTCSGSRFGTCCSLHGFCGSTDDYCSEGCQSGFGSCGTGPGVTSPPGSVTVTITSTVAVTRTSVVTQTSTLTATSTLTRTVGATATTTQTIRTTVVATSTSTVVRTASSIVTLTTISTSVATSTSIRTSTTTRIVNLTSVILDTITSVVTSTRVVTSGVCQITTSIRTPTSTRPPVLTLTQPGSSTPTLPGTPKNCRHYAVIRSTDNCRDLADRNNLTLLQFYNLNPSVSPDTFDILCTPEFIELLLRGLCQINCDALWEGYYVCVGT